MSEPILDHIGVKKDSPVRSYYRLFFTNRRLICALTVSSETRMLSSVGLSAVTGVLIGGAISDHFSDKSEKKAIDTLLRLTPDQILGTDKGNFAVEYADIDKVIMKKFGLVSVGKISIVTKGKTYSFELRFENMFDKWAQLVRDAIPGKLEII